jgi:hypothetical protein
MDNLPSLDYVKFLWTSYEHTGDFDSLESLDIKLSNYLSELLSVKVYVSVYATRGWGLLRVWVRVEGGNRRFYYPYDLVLRKEVFIGHVFKDFVFSH